MPDGLAIIQRVIAEHHAIKQSEQAVGQSVNDLEAVFSLQRAYSTWSQRSREALVEGQKKLQQTFNGLENGLRKHFAFEEESLPPIFGQILMRALLIEHKEINSKLGEAYSALTSSHLEEVDEKESLVRRMAIEQLIDGMNQMVEDHAAREEVILRMMEKAFVEPSGK